MGRCPVRLHQLPAIGPGTSDTAARPGRSVAAGNILYVGEASSLGAWRVLHGHLPGKPDARPSARSASGCTIPHHDSTPDQPAGRTPCASPTAGKFTEAIAGSAAKSQRGGHFGLCRRPIGAVRCTVCATVTTRRSPRSVRQYPSIDGRFRKYRSAGMMREAPTHALLQWFRGGSGVVSGPGTRPDPRSGRRRRGCPVTGVSAGSRSWHPPALPV